MTRLAARAIRSGDAIAAVYIPADFERTSSRTPSAGRCFSNQQFLTARHCVLGRAQSVGAVNSRAARAAEGTPHRFAVARRSCCQPERTCAVSATALLPVVITVVIGACCGLFGGL